jgi:hypothetical protein
MTQAEYISPPATIMQQLILAVFLIVGFITPAKAAPTFTALASVNQSGPFQLTPGPNGVYYGATTGGGANNVGTVYQMTPPSAGGSWTNTTLFSFNGTTTGNEPWGGLVSDKQGNLYGTTLEGGTSNCVFGGPGDALQEPYECGEVFELSPPVPPSTTWTLSIIHAFRGPYYLEGWNPSGTLAMDANGNLFGTTQQGGPVGGNPKGALFKLAPPSTQGGAWTISYPHTFQGTTDGNFPEGGLTIASTGVLYGTTTNNPANTGTVFSLTPNGGGEYTFQTIYSFTGGSDGGQPVARPIIDASGNLYGTTQYGGVYNGSQDDQCSGYHCGVVYELSPPVPPSTSWTETVLHSFGYDVENFQGQDTSWDGAEPLTQLVLDASGNLYGTTSEGGTYTSGPNVLEAYGTLFQLTPQAGGGWAESILYNFTGGNVRQDGSAPNALIFGSGGLYGTSDSDAFPNGAQFFSITGY